MNLKFLINNTHLQSVKTNLISLMKAILLILISTMKMRNQTKNSWTMSNFKKLLPSKKKRFFKLWLCLLTRVTWSDKKTSRKEEFNTLNNSLRTSRISSNWLLLKRKSCLNSKVFSKQDLDLQTSDIFKIISKGKMAKIMNKMKTPMKLKWIKILKIKIKIRESKIIKNQIKNYPKSKNYYLRNNKLNSRKISNNKSWNLKMIMSFRKIKKWIMILWMMILCWNLMNSKFKTLWIDFSPNPVFKDLNTWRASSSY